jgi:hypothetical protein
MCLRIPWELVADALAFAKNSLGTTDLYICKWWQSGENNLLSFKPLLIEITAGLSNSKNLYTILHTPAYSAPMYSKTLEY